MFRPVYIASVNAVSPIGMDLKENWQSLLSGSSAIRKYSVGQLNDIYTAKLTHNAAHADRTLSYLENLLVQAAKPILAQHSLSDRTAFILSTTKGNIELLKEGKVEESTLGKLAQNVATYLGFKQQPIIVSQACVSGLLAVSVAKRLIQIGQYDNALVLAGDLVSEFVLSGFNAFQAMSDSPCRPFDVQRNGVSLGEATAAAWVTKKKEGALVEIMGEASVNDANHISGPSRTGEGLVRSVTSALQEAQVEPVAIDLISAHGTATNYNDEMEAIAFNRLGLAQTPLNSLKGYYGHTLGASGLLELVILIQSLLQDTGIPTKGFETLGTSVPVNVIQKTLNQPMQIGLKTASGFGGSNAAMVIKKVR